MYIKKCKRKALHLILFFFAVAFSFSFAYAYNSHEIEDNEAFIDFAITGIKQPKSVIRKNQNGLRFPFFLRNNTTEKYRVIVSIQCLEGGIIEIFSQKPGTKKQNIFLPFNPSEREKKHIEALKKGQEPKLEDGEQHPFHCSIEISNMADAPGFTRFSDPADADLTNNSVTFTLAWKDGKFAIKDSAHPRVSRIEKEKQYHQPLTSEELEPYKTLSKNQCLNILMASGARGMYYNGELLGERTESGLWDISDAHIKGDRLAYIQYVDFEKHVIVDGQDYGLITEDSSYQFTPTFLINKKHFAFIKGIDPKNNDYRIVFDGKELDKKIDSITPMRLYDDFLFYQTLIDGKINGFTNDKDLGAYVIAYDGKNIVKRIDDKLSITYNGKKVGHTRRGIALQDDHFGFIDLTSNDEQLVYDGKRFGTAIAVFIEKDHLAYLGVDKKGTDPAHFIYDGKDFGVFTGENPSLEGDHFAFIRDTRKFSPDIAGPPLSVINIDGKDYPGNFFSYVEVTKKENCF